MDNCDEVITFIERFIKAAEPYKPDAIEKAFSDGFCYYFAVMLKTAFNRGSIVLAAPYGHIIWKDDDGKYYDIYGNYSGYLFDIPIEALGDGIEDFMHVPGKERSNNREEVVQLIEQYAPDKETAEEALRIISNSNL